MDRDEFALRTRQGHGGIPQVGVQSGLAAGRPIDVYEFAASIWRGQGALA
jgi:hypothetical protein